MAAWATVKFGGAQNPNPPPAAAPPAVAAVRDIFQGLPGVCMVLPVLLLLQLCFIFFLFIFLSLVRPGCVKVWASCRLSCFAQSRLRRLCPVLRAAGFHPDARARLQRQDCRAAPGSPPGGAGLQGGPGVTPLPGVFLLICPGGTLPSALARPLLSHRRPGARKGKWYAARGALAFPRSPSQRSFLPRKVPTRDR